MKRILSLTKNNQILEETTGVIPEVEEEPVSEGAVSGAGETLPNTDADKISVSTRYAVTGEMGKKYLPPMC